MEAEETSILINESKIHQMFSRAHHSLGLFSLVEGVPLSYVCTNVTMEGAEFLPDVSPSGSLTRSKGHSIHRELNSFQAKERVMLAYNRKAVLQSTQVILSSLHYQELQISRHFDSIYSYIVKIGMHASFMCVFNIHIIHKYNVFLIFS